MNQSASGTPGGAGGGKKPQRAQNVVPVQVASILEHSGETFQVQGQDVGMVVLVGQVKAVDAQATKNVYHVEDETGSIDAMHWVDEGQENTASNVTENMFVRVVGSVRSNQDKKHVMVYRILQLDDEAEIAAHALEVAHARLKIKQMQDKENQAIGGGGAGGLSNSMMTGYGSGGAAAGGGGGTYGNAQQNMVYKMIAACGREEGLSRDELATQLNGRVGKADVNSALEYLSSEGHVYSTIDDDHFKAMDG